MADPQIPSPQDLGLEVSAWRPGQEELLRKLNDALDGSKSAVVDAPPGLGKTAVAVALARMRCEPTIILTATKALQGLYADDPTRVIPVTGRGNHPCLLVPGATANDGPCLSEFRCPERYGGCLYFKQRDSGIQSRIVVANYALVLADPDHAFLEGRQLLICDEAHLLEEQLANHLGCEIEPWPTQVTRLGLPPLPDIPDPLALREWGAMVLEKMSGIKAELERAIESSEGHIPRKVAHLNGTLNRLDRTCNRLHDVDDTWVVTRGESQADKPGTVLVRPTHLEKLAHQALFYYFDHVVFLSGSILSPDRFRRRLGLESATWISVSSPIPPARRPIVYWPVVPVSQKTYRWSLAQIVLAVDKLIDRFLGQEYLQKGIVHTINTKIRDFLVAHSRYSNLFFIHGTEDRAEVYQDFRDSPGPAVLVSPSAFVGEDFPGDQARWQAIVKVPYPDLGDQWVLAQKEQDPGWYEEKAAAALVQACGRIVRGPDDHGVTYILDTNFQKLWQQTQFPTWFHDGLKVGREKFGGKSP